VIKLVTLGSLQLLGETGPLLAGRRKILALLACLLRRAPESMRRAELAALLWNDRNENYAKQSLRQALAELRPVIGDALIADSEAVLIDPDEIKLDAHAFENAVRLERWDEAAQLWGGDFLHGLDALAGETWSVWLAEERDRLRQGAARTFAALHNAATLRNDRRFAIEWAQKWCDVAPLDEAACTARINALVRAGRPVDAAVAYENFTRRTHNELHRAPSAEFEALKETFAAGRPAPTDKVLVRGAVTISGLTQLGLDARAVAEAAAVIGGASDSATLQAISRVTSVSFKFAMSELVKHGIMQSGGDGRWEFASSASRDQVLAIVSRHRRLNLEQAVALRFGTPVEVKRAATPTRRPAVEKSTRKRFVRAAVLAAGVVGILLFAGGRWVAGLATANAVELAPGSTVLLDHVRDDSDPTLAGAINTAAALGLSQSRHVALYKPRAGRDSSRATDAARIRALARRERIPRIISLDITGTDSALRVAARLIDGSSGEVLGEESVDTRRARLVDDLDRLLRKVRVTLGESEAIVRDSSRLLREVGSASLEALSAYADGLEAWTADRPTEARAAWARALKQDSSFALAELALANDAFTRQDADEGDRWARRAVSHTARLTALDALRARQMIAMRDGRLDEAATLAEQVARRAPSSKAWVDLASAHVAANRCADAITAFERAIAADSTEIRARFGIADCALAQGNATLALKHLESAHRMDSTSMNAGVYAIQRGRVLARANRLAEADSAFRGALSGSVVDSANAWRWLAQLQMMRGRFGEALPMLASASRLARQAGDAQLTFDNLVLEASAFTAMGGRTRASELIDEAVAVATAHPVSVSSYFQLGHLMARIGRLNGAREILRQASQRVAQEGGANQWPVRLLTASLLIAERNGADALTNIDAPNAGDWEPFRLALISDANALAGQHEAALDAARKLSQSWHFGESTQDEWLRALLRVARISEMAGDTATARTSYSRYIERWKDADVFLVELSMAQRSLVRLGGGVMPMAPAAKGR
jgi:DNA-binding SARP family transcriptional activator/tetratricopeptide (TPR) repeat protein